MVWRRTAISSRFSRFGGFGGQYSSVPFDSQAGRSGVDGFTGSYHRETNAPNYFCCMGHSTTHGSKPAKYVLFRVNRLASKLSASIVELLYVVLSHPSSSGSCRLFPLLDVFRPPPTNKGPKSQRLDHTARRSLRSTRTHAKPVSIV